MLKGWKIELRALKSLNPSKSLSNHTHLKSSKNHSSKVGGEVSKCVVGFGSKWMKSIIRPIIMKYVFGGYSYGIIDVNILLCKFY